MRNSQGTSHEFTPTCALRLPSHGRGRWFNPSRAHHSSQWVSGSRRLVTSRLHHGWPSRRVHRGLWGCRTRPRLVMIHWIAGCIEAAVTRYQRAREDRATMLRDRIARMPRRKGKTRIPQVHAAKAKSMTSNLYVRDCARSVTESAATVSASIKVSAPCSSS